MALSRGKFKRIGIRTIRYIILGVFVLFTALPFAWMLVTSFKEDIDLYNIQNNPFWFNAPPTLKHWDFIFNRTLYPQWVVNTLFVGILVVGITLLLAIPAAYSLARLLGRWGEQMGISIFLVYLVPSTLLFIPLARIVTTLHLQNT